jgi:dolichol-phosphate mannosyltransferase
MPRTPVTAVICALNEAATIADVVDRCAAYVDEILVVDGHSSDRTAEIAAKHGAKVILDSGRGKGAAVRESIVHATGDIVVFLDADGSHDPADIPRLVEPIVAGQADHVSASRLLGGSSELHGGFDECFRLMGSSFITAMINWRFGVRLSESQNGFRAIRLSTLRCLDLRERSTTIEQEMIIKSLRGGFRMAEVPAHEHRRVSGCSHIRIWRVAPRYVWSMLKYLFL